MYQKHTIIINRLSNLKDRARFQMTLARSEVVIDGVEMVYHVVSRCVRRAFLCGMDNYTGKSYEHRKEWVRSRLEDLAAGFAMEICAYTVMSNHIHLILRTRPDWSREWTNEEMAQRWLSIFPKRRDFDHLPKSPNEQEIRVLANDSDRMKEIRARLSSVSWFMRCFNEYIARRANWEDKCKGRFWEGRFKCQALLDEAAYLAAMTYVDLNPIRAGIAQTPEESEYTSVNDRIVARQASQKVNGITPENPISRTRKQEEMIETESSKIESDSWLCPIDNEAAEGPRGILPLNTDQYIDLVDWTGRLIREDKMGAIPDHLAPIMTRLEIDQTRWVATVQNYGSQFHRMVGKIESMVAAAEQMGRRWWQGMNACRKAFSPA